MCLPWADASVLPVRWVKLAFVHIEDGSGRIQLMLRVNELGKEQTGLVQIVF